VSGSGWGAEEDIRESNAKSGSRVPVKGIMPKSMCLSYEDEQSLMFRVYENRCLMGARETFTSSSSRDVAGMSVTSVS